MKTTDKQIDEITAIVAHCFSTFGGGKVSGWGNPLSEALKERPAMFAAGVDVRQVVTLVIDQAKCPMKTAKKPKPKAKSKRKAARQK